MIKYKISEIVNIVGGKFKGKNINQSINNIFTDSRILSYQKDSIFVAINGKYNNGHYYINELYKKNIKNFIVSIIPENIEQYNNVNFILVDNTIDALQLIASDYRAKFNIPVIGITGSNGKTIVKEWLSNILSLDRNVTRSPRSFNSQIGVPLSIFKLDEISEIAVFEAGISMPNEMARLQKIINPTIGIFTNIGYPHQDNFNDFSHKINEKLKLFTNAKKIIYCKDDNEIHKALLDSKLNVNAKLISWSKKSDADLIIRTIIKQVGITEITAKYNSQVIKYKIPFTDIASIDNSIICLLSLLELDIAQVQIIEGLANLAQVEMRLELKKANDSCYLINDFYNSDLGSLLIAIEYLQQQSQNSKKTIIMSDIIESSKNPESLYSEIADIVNKNNIYRFVGIGEEVSKFSALFKCKSHFYKTTIEFIQNIPSIFLKEETILLKGARKYLFEQISNLLQEKTHETILEVNLNSIVHNYNFYKSLLKKETKIMAMVKAFSYGSGIVEVSNLLEHHRVDYLAVAYIDEGVELRKAGISVPILVLNPDIKSFNVMVEYNLEPEIYSFKILNDYIFEINKSLIDDYPIHLKLDTGMHRLGFESKDYNELVGILRVHKKLKIKSVFTHLVGSDNFKFDEFTNFQVSKYLEFVDKLSADLGISFIKHILNSSGIERFTDFQFDMVRLGIGLYGISDINKSNLLNVCSLKTRISQIKNVSKNDTVGYNRKGKVKKNSVIATIPIGYADGLSRLLSNGVGEVMINNKVVPIVGNICMDMTMIDITDVNANEGDEVVIFDENYSIENVSKNAKTIPYEILTSISSRVKRIYYYE